jgi:hypothetical protein
MLVSIALNAQERSGDICVDVKCVRNTTKNEGLWYCIAIERNYR